MKTLATNISCFKKYRAVTYGLLLTTFIALVALPIAAKWEQEQVMLETSLQERIERALSKTFEPSSYLVTVRVEIEDRSRASSVESKAGKKASNPFLEGKKFLLPGVPVKKGFADNASVEQNTVVNASSIESLIRRIVVTVLVAPEVAETQQQAIQDLVRAAVNLRASRGDVVQIKASNILKPNRVETSVSGSTSGGSASSTSTVSLLDSWVPPLLKGSYWPMITLVLLFTIALILIAFFLFGPVRVFLNRLLVVLPRVGEQAAYAASGSGAGAGAGAPAAVPVANPMPYYSGNNGNSLQVVDQGEPRPFQFIREQELPKLPLLLQQLTPTEAALVLAYLPPDWASRVLAQLDSTMQSSIVKDLSRAREVPAEAVNRLQQQLKDKLPYFVGGIEWVQSVYQLTGPQMQRHLLGALTQDAPDVAETLRDKTVFFEDLVNLPSATLRQLVQEVGFPVVAQALKDESVDYQERFWGALPPGIRDIIRQEFELTNGDRANVDDAKNRLMLTARKMILDGRMTLQRNRPAA